jgi:hypothetical protein
VRVRVAAVRRVAAPILRLAGIAWAGVGLARVCVTAVGRVGRRCIVDERELVGVEHQ